MSLGDITNVKESYDEVKGLTNNDIARAILAHAVATERVADALAKLPQRMNSSLEEIASAIANMPEHPEVDMQTVAGMIQPMTHIADALERLREK